MPEVDLHEGDDPREVAGVLRRSLGIIAVLVIINALAAWMTTPDVQIIVLYGVILIFLGVAWMGLERGHSRGVAVWLVLTLYVAVTAAVAMFGGLRSATHSTRTW